MKKTYIIPEIMVQEIAPATLLANSPGGNDEIGSGEELVKERRGDDYSGSRTSVGSVWDDDWSK